MEKMQEEFIEMAIFRKIMIGMLGMISGKTPNIRGGERRFPLKKGRINWLFELGMDNLPLVVSSFIWKSDGCFEISLYLNP